MWKDEDPGEDPLWLNAVIAVTGIIYVLNVFVNFWFSISALLG